MQVVWEANTADFAKRKRAARACSTCQKRKKRCHHTFARDSTGENSIVSDDFAGQSDIDQVLPNLTHKDPIRFVGDSNPESILTDLSSRAKGVPRENRLGIWLEPSREVESQDARRSTESDGRMSYPPDRYSKVERAPRILKPHEKQYLQAAGAFRVLPRETQDILVTTFISCVDSLLPVLDGAKLLKKYAEGTASIFLIQAVCLITCKTEEAAPFLRLTEDGPVLEAIPFSRALHTGLDAAMKADLESDRLTKVQILTLMSLHNDGPGEFEESSMHLAQAIHNAHTAGLHIHSIGRQTNDEASYTWWCIWALDKFSACLSGRAVMIADRDIGLERPDVEPGERSQSIGLWLALADLLEDVIAYYRPTANPDLIGWELNFPSFEQVAGSFTIVQMSHKYFLELCYHIIAILTCRSGGPSTISYVRRVVSANRIQEIMSLAKLENLAPLPQVPYAVSLSLTVAYRVLRDKDPSYNLLLAKQDLTTRCELLEQLSLRWWSADAMAKLGRKALKSLKTGNISGGEENVAGLMEAEIAVCKHAPYDRPRNPLLPTDMTIETESSGNALELLSAAAATHANQQSKVMGASAYPPLDQLVDTTLPPFTAGLEGVITVDPFQNLDMHFDDFFDVGMPTFLEYPLFDADAFAEFPRVVH